MNSFWRIFSLEFTAFVRSKSLAMLLAASAAWMLVAPFAFRGDGTAEGARQLALHYSLGGVAALLAVSLPNPIDRVASKPGRGLQRLAGLIERRARASGSYVGCVLD